MVQATIWKNPFRDAAYLYLPGILAVFLSHVLLPNDESVPFLLFAFIATGFLDSGHVYTTLWRTYFRRAELRRSRVYLWAPVAFFLLFFVWNWLQWNYLAAFVVYATVFHNIRQLLGISRWYQKLNKKWNRISDLFLYALCIIPFVAFHFRFIENFQSYYGTNELFFYPHESLYRGALLCYLLAVTGWVVFEAVTVRRHKDVNRTFSVLFAGFFYAAAFLWSNNASQVLFPLIVSHGFSYLALMDLSLRRIEPERYRLWVPTLLIAGTAFILGGAEFILEESWFEIGAPAKAFTNALFLTPLFCHYFFDGFLWRRQHPDSSKIY